MYTSNNDFNEETGYSQAYFFEESDLQKKHQGIFLEDVFTAALDTPEGSGRDCPINLDPELRLPRRERRKRENQKQKFEKRHPGLIDKIISGTVTAGDLKKYNTTINDVAPVIMIEIEARKYLCHKVLAKGTPQYALDRYNKLRALELGIDAMRCDTLFITLTQDRKETYLAENGHVYQATLDPVESWETGKKKLSLFLKNLKREWGFTYVWVAEAQYSGHAHYHIIAANPEVDLQKQYSKKRRCYYTNNDDLRYWIKSEWGLNNHVKIVVAEKGKAVGYCTKYLAKTWKAEEEETADRETQKAIRKSRLAVTLSQYTSSRLYGSSKGLAKRTEDYAETERQRKFDEFRTTLEVEAQNTNYDVDSICSLISRLCPRFQKVVLLANKTAIRFFSGFLDQTLDPDSRAISLAKDLGISMGCMGCIFTEYHKIRDNVEGRNSQINQYNRLVVIPAMVESGRNMQDIKMPYADVAGDATQNFLGLYQKWLITHSSDIFAKEINFKRHQNIQRRMTENEEIAKNEAFLEDD